MSPFLITLSAVGILLLTAVPGYLFIKTKLVGEEFIPGVSKILVYICQPAIAIYSFAGISFSTDTLKNMGVFTLLSIVIHAIAFLGVYFCLGKKRERVANRIICLASSCANCTFFGIPIIEALLPEIASELIVYATIYSLIMNIFGWTLGSAILSGNSKYISVKRIFLNPATIGTGVAFLIFLFSISIPAQILSTVTVMGKMATPLSMLVLGMRLATRDFRSLFLDIRPYISTAVKQIALPLIAFALVFFLPIDAGLKSVFYILSACPTASVVLAFAEMLGEGQGEASGAILLSTALSVLTMPVMILMLTFF